MFTLISNTVITLNDSRVKVYASSVKVSEVKCLSYSLSAMSSSSIVTTSMMHFRPKAAENVSNPVL